VIGINTVMQSILLVDDQPANLWVLFQTLKSMGCDLFVAKSGETALMIAQKAHPDLILLDIIMPGIDGFEVCRRLKADPATEKIPVIFLSARDETADKIQGLQLGAIDYVSKPFQPEEVIARVNTHLTIHRLNLELQNQRDQLEHELQVVSQLQRNLLPERLPHIDGLKLAVHYETSQYAGGDYYDILELPNGRWGFLVADAAGHSAPAAVMMAMTCALFHCCSTCEEEAEHMLSCINENLCKVNKESFVTAIYGDYDARRRTFRISRAGHPLPILYRSSERKAMEVSCPGVFAMGLGPFPQIPVTEITLAPGDRLLLYTDGVSELFNEGGEPYGEKRLLRQFETAASDDPKRILERINDDLARFAEDRPADDDQVILLVVVE
jgi:phosphoserine phosphatase RsbU/P